MIRDKKLIIRGYIRISAVLLIVWAGIIRFCVMPRLTRTIEIIEHVYRIFLILGISILSLYMIFILLENGMYKGIRYCFIHYVLLRKVRRSLKDSGYYVEENFRAERVAVLPVIRIKLDRGMLSGKVYIQNHVKFDKKLEDVKLSSCLGRFIVSQQYCSDDGNWYIYEFEDSCLDRRFVFKSVDDLKKCAESVGDYKFKIDKKTTVSLASSLFVGATGSGKTYMTYYLVLSMLCWKNRPSTIDSVHTVLHQVLELGVEDDYLRYNPSDNALRELKKAHNDDSPKRRALTLPEQEVFEKFLSQEGQYHRWYPIFVVMLGTGLRVGEVTGLRWCDVDFEEETINVNHTLVYYKKGDEGCLFEVNSPKTISSGRIIPMLPKVKEALLLEKKYQEELGIKCNVRVGLHTDFIFINRFGGVQHQGTLNKALRRIIRDCNYEVIDNNGETTLPRFSCHILRHTFATRLAEAGVHIKAAQELLGHRDIQTTLNIYTHASKDFKESEMISFNAFLNAQKEKTNTYNG